MENYSLPTPKEVNYGVDPNLQKVLDEIKSNLSNNPPIYTLNTLQNKDYYQVKTQVNNIINSFGWEITSRWIGTKDSGFNDWYIRPIQ